MKKIKTILINSAEYIISLFKWIIISIITGASGGLIGSLFHLSVDYVTELREKNIYLILLLPLGGIIIAGMYKLFCKKGKIDTNRVIESVREETDIPLIMMPLIFISTVITHFFGGSAGREGAALQIGGSIGYNLGKVIRLKKSDIHIITMAGMSAVFAALFGTPITAAIFSLEVTAVGIFHYAGLLPCVVSSITATFIASVFKISPVKFINIDFGAFTWDLAFKTVIVALLCALVSILFCLTLKLTEHIMGKYLKNAFVRAFTGGAIIVILTLVLGTADYNGAGMCVITKAMEGTAKFEAPFLKILFTAITISAGFKGGEIVPTFFIGSTFGCVIAPIVGLNPSIAAAIGFVALFCAMVNCPVASIFLALEVFGINGIGIFAIASSVSYLMSGCFGLYKSQKIIYSKINDEYICANTN